MTDLEQRGLSIKSLVGVALQHPDSETSWEAIHELRMRGSPEVLALAGTLMKSRNAHKRTLGVNIAAQLGEQLSHRQKPGPPLKHREYAPEETRNLLVQGLQDLNPKVLSAAAFGLGHRPHPPALPTLIGLANHPLEDVRQGVAFALGSYPDRAAMEALIPLARDPVDAVRDWATFALGSLREEWDSPALRAALWANIFDPNPGVQGEALAGLALRQDEGVLPYVLQALEPNCRVYELKAAATLASPLLLEKLQRLRTATLDEAGQNTYWHEMLMDAIEACTPPPEPSGAGLRGQPFSEECQDGTQ